MLEILMISKNVHGLFTTTLRDIYTDAVVDNK